MPHFNLNMNEGVAAMQTGLNQGLQILKMSSLNAPPSSEGHRGSLH